VLQNGNEANNMLQQAAQMQQYLALNQSLAALRSNSAYVAPPTPLSRHQPSVDISALDLLNLNYLNALNSINSIGSINSFAALSNFASVPNVPNLGLPSSAFNPMRSFSMTSSEVPSAPQHTGLHNLPSPFAAKAFAPIVLGQSPSLSTEVRKIIKQITTTTNNNNPISMSIIIAFIHSFTL